MMRTVALGLAALLFCFVSIPNRSPMDSPQDAPQTAEEPPKSCPVTKLPSPPFVPPAPYPSDGSAWFTEIMDQHTEKRDLAGPTPLHPR